MSTTEEFPSCVSDVPDDPQYWPVCRWSITCPWCGFWAKLTARAQDLPARVRCVHCGKPFRLEKDATQEQDSGMHRLRATGLPSSQSGWSYLILGSSLAASLYTAHRWGVLVGIATFITWLLIGTLVKVVFLGVGKR